MRILCRHGFFSFHPEDESDLARFCKHFELTLEKMQDFYTFPFLKNAPDYSISGAPLMNMVASKTFEGDPWEVLKENGLVYELRLGLLVPSLTVVEKVEINNARLFYLVEAGLVQPGARDGLGRVVMSYDAHYDFAVNRLYLRGYWSE